MKRFEKNHIRSPTKESREEIASGAREKFQKHHHIRRKSEDSDEESHSTRQKTRKRSRGTTQVAQRAESKEESPRYRSPTRSPLPLGSRTESLLTDRRHPTSLATELPPRSPRSSNSPSARPRISKRPPFSLAVHGRAQGGCQHACTAEE